MSFIKVGGYCFKKRKIVCIEASRTMLSGVNLLIYYDQPYAIPLDVFPSKIVSPTMDFNISYSKSARHVFVDDVKTILRGNPQCILDEYSLEVIKSCYE